MEIRNKILIVSNIPEQILEFRKKLSRLKSTNLIYSAKIENAVNTCTKFIPDVVIVFTNRNKPEYFIQFCRAVKANPILKNTSIIFIFEGFDDSFILSSFDAGISDYLITPIQDVDLLTRVIWAFQQKEQVIESERKDILLKKAGVIDQYSDIFTPNYVEYGLVNAIEEANKYQYPVVLMAITLDSKFKNDENDEYLATIIKNSTRKTDFVGTIDNKSFFLLLKRTNLNGAHIVYQKLINQLGELSISVGISIGVCESFSGMDYQKLSSYAINALKEAIKRGGNRIIVFNKELTEEENNNTNNNVCADVQQEEAPEPYYEEQGHSSNLKTWLEKINYSKKQYKYFSQEFEKKVNFIVNPVFQKVQNVLNENYSSKLLVEQFSTDTKCYFSIKDLSSGSEGLIQIIDPGTSKVIIDTSLISLGEQKNKRINLNIEELSQQKLENIIMTFFNEFEKNISF